MPLLRFYIFGAARLAQRNVLATLAILVMTLALAPDAVRLIEAIALAVSATDAPRAPALLPAAVAILMAQRALPTLRLGLGGWIASLPVSRRQHRRAMALAFVVPLAPLILAGTSSLFVTALVLDRSLCLPSIVGSAIGVLAAGAAAIPVRRGLLARPFALAGALVWIPGTWAAVGGSLGLLLLWDLLAGPVSLSKRPRPRAHLADRWILVFLAWRSLRLRLLYPTIAAVLLLGAAWLFRVNNQLSVAESALATRLATMCALLLGAGGLAEGMLARRRPWPWLRSLPSTSRRRVLEDVIALSVPALPTLLLAGALDLRAAAVGLACLPLLGTIAVLSLRTAGGRVFGAIGVLFWAGVVIVAGITVWPWMSIVALALTPGMVVLAARADRRRLVTGWEPLHHDAAGDSLSETSR